MQTVLEMTATEEEDEKENEDTTGHGITRRDPVEKYKDIMEDVELIRAAIKEVERRTSESEGTVENKSQDKGSEVLIPDLAANDKVPEEISKEEEGKDDNSNLEVIVSPIAKHKFPNTVVTPTDVSDTSIDFSSDTSKPSTPVAKRIRGSNSKTKAKKIEKVTTTKSPQKSAKESKKATTNRLKTLFSTPKVESKKSEIAKKSSSKIIQHKENTNPLTNLDSSVKEVAMTVDVIEENKKKKTRDLGLDLACLDDLYTKRKSFTKAVEKCSPNMKKTAKADSKVENLLQKIEKKEDKATVDKHIKQLFLDDKPITSPESKRKTRDNGLDLLCLDDLYTKRKSFTEAINKCSPKKAQLTKLITPEKDKKGNMKVRVDDRTLEKEEKDAKSTVTEITHVNSLKTQPSKSKRVESSDIATNFESSYRKRRSFTEARNKCNPNRIKDEKENKQVLQVHDYFILLY